jgi:hypothetical protein
MKEETQQCDISFTLAMHCDKKSNAPQRTFITTHKDRPVSRFKSVRCGGDPAAMTSLAATEEHAGYVLRLCLWFVFGYVFFFVLSFAFRPKA